MEFYRNCFDSNYRFYPSPILYLAVLLLLFIGEAFLGERNTDKIEVLNERILGVILDPNLTCEDHIAKTVSTCMSRLVQINRVKHVLD